ncbi:MAG: sensor histidine kinase [Anaerolineaceae bacterium]|nr:MAG: sensor histidine kinase [Anaerolineaceae bacterium]
MTIRKRLTLWYAALLTAVIVLFAAATYGVMRFTMLSNIDNGLTETASLIVRNSRVYPDPTFGAPARMNIELASLDALRAPGVYVQAWEIMDGEAIFKESSLTAQALNDTSLDAASLGTQEDIIRTTQVAGLDVRVLTKPITASGGGRVVGNIQVAVRLDQLNQATDTLLAVMLVACGIAIIGTAGLSMWFSHSALQPIKGITEAAATIANTNNLQTRMEWQGPNDELGRLTSVFNQMMERIEQLFSVQKRFVADISHELRTPLTAIKGHCDLMRRYGMDESSLEAIESEAVRMSRLVNDLLMLARADYGGVNFNLCPIDLDSVLTEAFEQVAVLAKNRDLRLHIRHFEPVRINGDPDRIKQVIYNLVSNAIKFTPDGGEITLGLEYINHHAVMWVKDTGIGLSEEDKLHVFDRFFQSESSRHHGDDEGFGLGLSIAKWIVEAHDGTISVSSRHGQGTTFTISIPAYDEQEGNHHHKRADSKPSRPRRAIIWGEPRPPKELQIVDSKKTSDDEHHRR